MLRPVDLVLCIDCTPDMRDFVARLQACAADWLRWLAAGDPGDEGLAWRIKVVGYRDFRHERGPGEWLGLLNPFTSEPGEAVRQIGLLSAGGHDVDWEDPLFEALHEVLSVTVPGWRAAPSRLKVIALFTNTGASATHKYGEVLATLCEERIHLVVFGPAQALKYLQSPLDSRRRNRLRGLFRGFEESPAGFGARLPEDLRDLRATVLEFCRGQGEEPPACPPTGNTAKRSEPAALAALPPELEPSGGAAGTAARDAAKEVPPLGLRRFTPLPLEVGGDASAGPSMVHTTSTEEGAGPAPPREPDPRPTASPPAAERSQGVPSLPGLTAQEAAQILYAYAERDIEEEAERRAVQQDEEVALARAAVDALWSLRSDGELGGRASFLSPRIRLLPGAAPSRDWVVLGDVHGCYNLVKAALEQTRFLPRVLAGEDVHLVCVGDYVDRGVRNFEVLRVLLALFCNFPDRVTLLRGNHDDLRVRADGTIRSGALPADWLEFWHLHEPHYFGAELFAAYAGLFDELPGLAVTGDGILFAHGGPPHPSRWEAAASLADLDEPELLYQVRWARAELHRESFRELPEIGNPSFGREDLVQFLGRFGLRTLVRGHDVAACGAERFPVDGEEPALWTVCSMGGRGNPHDGGAYGDVSPHMLLRTGCGPFEPAALDWLAATPPQDLELGGPS